MRRYRSPGRPIRRFSSTPGPYAATLRQKSSPWVTGWSCSTRCSTPARRAKEARAVVRAIRQERVVGDGHVVVGGQTALDLDSTDFILARTPYAVGFVVAVTLVVLFLLLGSGAFADHRRADELRLHRGVVRRPGLGVSGGQLTRFFDFEPARHHRVDVPVCCSPSCSALSMDYEVLLLSRVREESTTPPATTTAPSPRDSPERRPRHERRALLVVVGALLRDLAPRAHQDALGSGIAVAVSSTPPSCGPAGAGHHAPARRLELVGAAPLTRLRERLGWRA